MTDVRKALEVAAVAMNAYHHVDEDGAPPVDRIMREASRSAVLAFLRAMPNVIKFPLDIPPGDHLISLEGVVATPEIIVAAIEKETP